MKLLIRLVFLTLTIGCGAQTTEENTLRRFLKSHYEKQHFNKYAGDIKVNAINEVEEIDEVQLFYDNKSFKLSGVSETLKLIFEKGILYPQLISGFTTEPRKTDEELDSLSISEKVFYEMSRGDNLGIMNLEELEFLSDSPKIKRFQFWLWFPKTANPRVYLFELTNEEATDNTELNEFIENSSLTFLKMYNILI
ncbi:hypothetical protein EAX61_07750 [Dokdonia sinensis]|uniref:Lipoprotein n=1 Tax=Dokdonia sinensis TaxID=2479847 RepID=A0A3M0G3B7_9FLAO|nr:hypothetical protein [Dokdonia sinensis]RMB59470.1 hypothetical protein EAX61_07750 [Dokdonia sinensis]